MSLKAKASRAAFWSFIDRVAQYGLQTVVSVLLARLLLPSEVGLIGMLWVFIAIASILTDIGFSPALLQKHDSTDLDHCSVFYFNVVTSFLGVAALWIAAPSIAGFYGNLQLIPLTRAISLIIPFSAISLIHTTLLNKKLDIRTQAKASLISGIVSGCVAVVMAWKGFGVWSLVGQSLSQTLTRSVILWFASTWRPQLIFSWQALGAMFPFGSRVLLSASIGTIVDNVFPVAIGKFYSSTALGFYTMAARIPYTFASSLTSIVARVSNPVYPTLRSQPEALKRTYRKTMMMMSLINTPLMVGIAITAESFVNGVLTAKWVPAIPYIRLSCAYMIFLPFRNGGLDALQGIGRADLHLRVTILQRVLRLATAAISFQWGVTGLLTGELVVFSTTCFVQAILLGKIIGYPVSNQIRDVMPGILASFVMGGFVLCAHFLQFGKPLLDFIFQVGVGAAVFLGVCWGFRLRAFMEVLSVLQQLIERGRRGRSNQTAS